MNLCTFEPVPLIQMGKLILPMKQIKITLQYDGTNYSGWQVQKSDRTIQGLVEGAVFHVTGEEIRVTGASRTDAGVHALGHVASFNTLSDMEPDVFVRALNANLPQDIRVTGAKECHAAFHPRYSAKSKTYAYIISRAGVYSVFMGRYSWQMHGQLDTHAMREAAAYLTGKHDFSSFRASGCSARNPVREITEIDIAELDSIGFMTFTFNTPIIRIRIGANAFLRHMARNIVGTLVEVGRGRTPPENMEKILAARDRRTAGITAPARGLFLESIQY